MQTKFYFVLLGLFMVYSAAQGQKKIAPLSVGTLYSIVDDQRREVVPGLFEDVAIYEKLELVLLKKNELWGVYRYDGVKVLDHVIQVNQNYGIKAPEIARARKGNMAGAPPTTSNLHYILDVYANVTYYFNPRIILPKYKAYATQSPFYNVQQIPDINAVDNLFKVVNRDLTVNFIDSTGVEILPVASKEAKIINQRLLFVSDGQKSALFDRDKRITEYDFKTAEVSLGTSMVQLRDEVDGGKGYKKTRYHLYTDDGQHIGTSMDYPTFVSSYATINQDSSFCLYSGGGKKEFCLTGTKASLFSLGTLTYLMIHEQNLTSVMDLQGKIRITPKNSMRTQNKKLLMTARDTFFILDSNLNVVMQMKGVEMLEPTDQNDLFKFAVKDGWRTKAGIVDRNHKVIVEPEWRQVAIQGCGDLVILYTDTTKVLRKLGSIEDILIVPEKVQLSIDCRGKTVTSSDAVEASYYDFSGRFLQKRNWAEISKAGKYGIHKYTTVEKMKLSELQDEKGRSVLGRSFEEIESIYDERKKESVYICKFDQNSHPSTHVYNNELKVITPPGYSVPANWSRTNVKNPGRLLLVNDADVAKNKYYFRMAVCDYQGKWVIPPFYGTLKYIENGLFILNEVDKKRLVFYNRDGVKTCDRDFHIVDKGNGSAFFQNRIMVATISDKNYLDKVKALGLEKLEMNEAIEKFQALGEPNMKYGYLNLKGTMVLEQNYIHAKPFPMSDTKTFVTILREGKAISQVIDTLGKVYFEVPFAEIDRLSDSLYMVKQGDYFAVANLKGEVKTPFQFTSISHISKSGICVGKKDKEYFIISDQFKVVSLGPVYNMDVTLSGEYIIAKKINKVADSNEFEYVFHIFDKELNELAIITNAVQVDNLFNGLPLPHGYLSVYKDHMHKIKSVYDVTRKEMMVK